MLQTVIFIGRSGAGKGVQSANLQKFLKEKYPETPTLYIETGAHFREFVKNEGYTWERARAVNHAGGRQPEFLAVWVWAGLFIGELKGNEHIVFDGTPRSLGEAQMLSTALPFYERKILQLYTSMFHVSGRKHDFRGAGARMISTQRL